MVEEVLPDVPYVQIVLTIPKMKVHRRPDLAVADEDDSRASIAFGAWGTERDGTWVGD